MGEKQTVCGPDGTCRSLKSMSLDMIRAIM